MKQKKVLLYCSGIDNVLSGSSKVAGIQVQMAFWAKTFVKYGWKVFAFSDKGTQVTGFCVCFIKLSPSKLLSKLHLQLLMQWWGIFKGFLVSKPDVVITRGASRILYPLSLICKIFHIKLVFFGASDTDFEMGNEIVGGISLNRKLYQKSIRRIDYIVVQNVQQSESLKKHYQKDSLLLANLWATESCSDALYKTEEVVFVSNLWPIRRAEWFVRLAAKMPDCRFKMIGGASRQSYYNNIEQMANDVPNLEFFGPLSFDNTSKCIAQSKLLVCTSEFEGFPNTFLQAWANGVPVVSTVDPSCVISEYELGRVVSDEDQLYEKVRELLESKDKYNVCVKSIDKYFLEHHSAEKAIGKLLNYIQ